MYAPPPKPMCVTVFFPLLATFFCAQLVYTCNLVFSENNMKCFVGKPG